MPNAATDSRTGRNGLSILLIKVGPAALLLGLAALCTRAMLTGQHPAIMALVAASVCGGLYWRHVRQRESMMEAQLAEALEHFEAELVARYRQGRRTHPYGAVDDRNWRQDLDKFLETVISPKPRNFAAWRNGPTGQFFARWAEEFVVRRIGSAA